MSDLIFHKSCYTSRSTGYKYRTLATNTGEKKRRDTNEDNVFDRKMKELKRAILSRINKNLNETQKARDNIMEKFDKINTKINTMIELQETVKSLRKDLCAAENTLQNCAERMEKLDYLSSDDSTILSLPYKHYQNSQLQPDV